MTIDTSTSRWMKAAAAIVLATIATTWAGLARAADPPHGPPSDARPTKIALSQIPLVEASPPPRFHAVRTSKETYANHAWVLPADERLTGVPIDFSAAPRALQNAPKLGGAISVVRTNNLDYQGHHEPATWLRFFQKNPDVPAFTASCGRGADIDRSVESFTLHAAPDGSFRYVYHHVWFNFATCKGVLLRHFDTAVAPIAGGLAFAYRTTCARCERGQRERVHLVQPSSQRARISGEHHEFAYFTYMTEAVEASLEPGESATFHAQFEGPSLRTWNRVLAKPLRTPPMTTLRVEIVRAADDPAPAAFAWIR